MLSIYLLALLWTSDLLAQKKKQAVKKETPLHYYFQNVKMKFSVEHAYSFIICLMIVFQVPVLSEQQHSQSLSNYIKYREVADPHTDYYSE